MAPIVVGDVIRVVAKMRLLTSEDDLNVFHFKVLSNTTVDDNAFMVEMAAAIDSDYQIINAQISTAMTYIDIDAQNVTQNELLQSQPWPVLVAGADAGALLPTQVAAMIFWRTLRPKTRTSKFYGGFTELSNNVDGTIAAATATQLSLLGTNLLGGVSGANFSAEYGAFNKLLSRFTPVTSSVVPVRWRTQKKRRVGVGS